jgi:uncharacterized membrane protein
MLSKLKGLALVLCVFAGADILLPKPALADTQFCNRTGIPVQIAYRTQNGTLSSNYFITSGWTYIGPHTCRAIASGDASLFYHFISIFSPRSYGFLELDGQLPYAYCVRSSNFAYTGSPRYCTGEYFTAPFYKFNSDTPNATFFIY